MFGMTFKSFKVIKFRNKSFNHRSILNQKYSTFSNFKLKVFENKHFKSKKLLTENFHN